MTVYPFKFVDVEQYPRCSVLIQ